MVTGAKESEPFSEPLGEIIRGLSAVAEAVGSEYQGILGIDSVLIPGLSEQRDRLRNNLLGRIYGVWQDSPADSVTARNAWRRFVKEYDGPRNLCSTLRLN